MASTTTPLTVTLTGDSTWHIWVELLKTRALESDIWQYINPNTLDRDLPSLIQPIEPTFQDVHLVPEGQSVTVSDLTTIEYTHYQTLKFDYREDIKLYREKERAMARMRSLIQASIDKSLITHTINCSSARDMLLNLKAQYCANAAVRERQLLAEYYKAKVLSTSELIENWLQNWEATYFKCKEINASEVDGSKPFFDFIHAVQERVPGFHSAWYFKILRDTEGTLKIKDLVQEFKDYLRDLQPTRSKGKHSAFATFQQDDSNSANSNSNPRLSYKTCVCGSNHWFRQCYYLNPTIRKAGWKPDPEIESKIKEKLKSDSQIKAAVDKYKIKLQQQQNSKGSKDQLQDQSNTLSTALLASAAYNATQPTWNLYNSFILDSGATTHICHTRTV